MADEPILEFIAEISIIGSVLSIVASILKINEWFRARDSPKGNQQTFIVNVLVQNSPGAIIRIGGPEDSPRLGGE